MKTLGMYHGLKFKPEQPSVKRSNELLEQLEKIREKENNGNS